MKEIDQPTRDVSSSQAAKITVIFSVVPNLLMAALVQTDKYSSIWKFHYVLKNYNCVKTPTT